MVLTGRGRGLRAGEAAAGGDVALLPHLEARLHRRQGQVRAHFAVRDRRNT